MIIFIYGTTAEAIKIAPIARRLDARGIPYRHWVTQQHTAALREAIPQLGLHPPDRVIADGWRGKPLKTPLQMVGWIGSVLRWTLRNARPARRVLPRDSIVIVHGDTVTTVLGAFIGRVLGLPVAHVEAGLRSGDWRHPFPEELDRRIVGRLASVHYAPSDEAVRNLGRRKGVVPTHGNTVTDAVRDAAGGGPAPAERYGLALLHRFEFISHPDLVRATLRTIDESATVPVRIVVDEYSRGMVSQVIEELGLQRYEVVPKLEHGAFVDVLRGAEFVVTDSGGIQEEAAALGIPTLIHRMATERSEGLGTSAVLSKWDQGILRDFLLGYEGRRRDADGTEVSPSDIVVDDLVARGYGVTARRG